jgi:hypothetical protein
MQSDTRRVLVSWMRQFGVAMVVYLAALAAATWALTSVPGMRTLEAAAISAIVITGK